MSSEQNKKKIIVIALVLALVTVIGAAVAVCILKNDDGELYTYIAPDGKVFEYYIDVDGKAYTYDDDEKSKKVYYGPIIPRDVFGTVMTAPYVYSTTAPSPSEANGIKPGIETGESSSN